MRHDLLTDLKRALGVYAFKTEGSWLRQGKCPKCAKKSLWTHADAPWVLRCDRLNSCKFEGHVKTLFPELFENWSARHPVTEAEPNAAADAYLDYARGLKLTGLRGAYSQETYRSQESGETTATVRFPIVEWGAAKPKEVSWWERFIDKPWRFGDMKARFAPGRSYKGEWWAHPEDTPEAFALATELWLPEGVFDTVSLREHGLVAASLLSCNNYPEKALARLRVAVNAARIADPSVKGPKLIFAFDADNAGRHYILKFVEQARAEGWEAGAAQIPQPARDKLDWNDLHLLQKNPGKDRKDALPLADEKLKEYLWRGDLLLAASPSEKAILLNERADRATFPFDFGNRLWWANIDPARVAELTEMLRKSDEGAGLDEAQLKAKAIRRALKVSQIANCHPRPLYFQIDRLTDESWYYYRLDFPGDGPSVKNIFTPSQIAKAASFKERLLAVAPMATFTGNTGQLDRLHDLNRHALRTVEALNYVGYSREHGAYVFNDIAVRDGKIVPLNSDDYFELGPVSVKSVDRSVDLQITPWDKEPDFAWLDDLWNAFGPKGMVALTFWFGSFFAEQVRAAHSSYPFLCLRGPADMGKSTIIEFLWKLCGRHGYEGFDPSKATPSARARNFAQVGNMPVVLMEGDRDDTVSASRKFDFNELKSLYNGRSTRSRGVRTSGNETYEPPFRGAIVIEQNHAIVTQDDAIPTRLVDLVFDGTGYSAATKKAADRLGAYELADVSGFILHACRNEAAVVGKINGEFPAAELLLMNNPQVGHRRIAKCHGQMLAVLDAFALVTGLSNDRLAATRDLIVAMAVERKAAIATDHPVVEAFWEAFDWMGERAANRRADASYASIVKDNPLDHHRDPDLIAVNLNDFAAEAAKDRIPVPEPDELKRHLRTSKVRKFVDLKPVNSTQTSKAVFCWVFEAPPAYKERRS